MSRSVRGLPNPTPEAVQIFLKQLNRSKLHEAGWIEINKRFHGVGRAARPFIREHFGTPEEQEAAFDGLTLGLITLAHFMDIEQLQTLFKNLPKEKPASASQLQATKARPDPNTLPKNSSS